MPALHEALADIGYAGPLILECAGDLAGPSLATRTVDERRLRSDLLDSMAMLGDVRARAEGRVAPGPGL